ncbi:tetratricopeptide repeat protein [Rubinisphaera sp.]|uniref:tetratricopeptide repeat protein n=1 Tax=Rubinisphaera sp. TaxID=2024857 RepID=UPI000C0DF46D|nr:tetratricopeptide repeat protein [Rubinisphaera sp.]MBV09705.1 hypothetical protein [Rubinisphaera sp.]HCS54120.1 hypothetical protein [Planctomycetaceae bacterium]|tara:strand:- start:1220 stop:3904 length:2685 start_codon:yes stop_codon:yes gene_type:complete
MAATPPVESDTDLDDLPIDQSSTSMFGIYPMLALAIMIGIGLPTGIWVMIREPEMTPLEKTVESIEFLKQGRTRTAYMQAIQMLDDGVAEPEIGGSLEYVIGVALFRKAERVSQEAAVGYEGIVEPTYRLAMRYLEKANQKSLLVELIPSWQYALGSCYYNLGQIYDAREILESAYDIAEENRDDIILMLAQCYLDPNVLKSALVHPTNIIEQHKKRTEIIQALKYEFDIPEPNDIDADSETDPETNAEEIELTEIEKRYLATLCLADLQRQDGDLEGATRTIQNIKVLDVGDELSQERLAVLHDKLLILKARVHLDQKEMEEARKLLSEIINSKSGLDQKSILTGHFLLGMTYAAEDRFDIALKHLSKPTAVSDSAVYFPANMYAGDIARKRGFHEEALVYFLHALSNVGSTDQFANPWIDLDESRKMIRNAWNDWGDSDSNEQYRFAQELTQKMVPLFSIGYTNELTALVSRKRAELISREYESQKNKSIKLKEVQDSWKTAGHAYAQLANSSRATNRYSQILWESSEFYRQGNDFENALRMLNRFIASNPRTGLLAAYNFKAKLLLDLDGYDDEPRLDQAIQLLQATIHDYPKDQLVYDTQLLLGRALLENGETEQAIKVWRSLILESPLTPEAAEWQQALFALGRTLFHVTETRPDFLRPKQDTLQQAQSPRQDQRYEQVEEAIQWLDEFVRRIPEHESIHEARWLLAKGLRFRARRPESQLRMAETENMKQELNSEIYRYLDQSSQQYRILSEELSLLDQRGKLNSLTRQFLRDSFFEPAHIQFDLGQFENDDDSYRKAIDLYSNAAFYFTGEPVVLVAYFRIAECYRNLQAYAEARRQLEQARVILTQIPEPFPQSSTNFTKQEWEQLLEQSIRLYDLAIGASPQTLN